MTSDSNIKPRTTHAPAGGDDRAPHLVAGILERRGLPLCAGHRPGRPSPGRQRVRAGHRRQIDTPALVAEAEDQPVVRRGFGADTARLAIPHPAIVAWAMGRE